MRSPFHLIIPPETWGKRAISKEYPANYKYKISMASPLLLKVKEGEFLLQSFAGFDYFFEFWSFSLNSSGSVSMKVSQPFIGLIICFKGRGLLFPDEESLTMEMKLTLCYYPKGMYQIALSNGDTALVVVIPPISYLHSMAIEHLAVRDLYNKLQFNCTDIMYLDSLPLSHGVLRIIKQLEISKEKAASLDHIIRVYMLQLLSIYNKQLRLFEGEENNIAHTGEKKVTQIREYIDAHLLDEKLGETGKIAQTFQVRLDFMRKEFKQSTGKTIQEYIRHKRLTYARKLISENELQVFEVADMVGYSTTSNFVRAYKRMFGHPPGNENKNGF